MTTPSKAPETTSSRTTVLLDRQAVRVSLVEDDGEALLQVDGQHNPRVVIHLTLAELRDLAQGLSQAWWRRART